MPPTPAMTPPRDPSGSSTPRTPHLLGATHPGSTYCESLREASDQPPPHPLNSPPFQLPTQCPTLCQARGGGGELHRDKTTVTWGTLPPLCPTPPLACGPHCRDARVWAAWGCQEHPLGWDVTPLAQGAPCKGGGHRSPMGSLGGTLCQQPPSSRLLPRGLPTPKTTPCHPSLLRGASRAQPPHPPTPRTVSCATLL